MYDLKISMFLTYISKNFTFQQAELLVVNFDAILNNDDLERFAFLKRGANICFLFLQFQILFDVFFRQTFRNVFCS